MKTYKLGNKVNCILRSVAAGKIGDQEMTYANQPYTVIKDVEASLTFKDINSSQSSDFNKIAFSKDALSEVRVSNVELNDKILNLIFSSAGDTNVISTMQNCEAEDGKIYITTSEPEIYQVFIYNSDGQLEKAYGILTEKEIKVERNDNYLVFFSYLADKSYQLSRKQDMYLYLDLIIEGNSEDSYARSMVHVDKCSLIIDKNLYFNRQINAVDLRFVVVGNDSYITLE